MYLERSIQIPENVTVLSANITYSVDNHLRLGVNSNFSLNSMHLTSNKKVCGEGLSQFHFENSQLNCSQTLSHYFLPDSGFLSENTIDISELLRENANIFEFYILNPDAPTPGAFAYCIQIKTNVSEESICSNSQNDRAIINGEITQPTLIDDFIGTDLAPDYAVINGSQYIWKHSLPYWQHELPQSDKGYYIANSNSGYLNSASLNCTVESVKHLWVPSDNITDGEFKELNDTSIFKLDLNSDGICEAFDIIGDRRIDAYVIGQTNHTINAWDVILSNGRLDAFDTTKDGYPDNFDFNDDGLMDAWSVLDGKDKHPQKCINESESLDVCESENVQYVPGQPNMWDTDNDTSPDAFDTTGDGKINCYSTRPDGVCNIFDFNSDGIMDAWSTREDGQIDQWDTTGDGRADRFDTTGDGLPDHPPIVEPSNDVNTPSTYQTVRKFLWKPISENDQKLVILHSPGDQPAVIYDKDGNILEEGRNRGSSNGYDETVRFNNPGRSYTEAAYVKMGDNYACDVTGSKAGRIETCIPYVVETEQIGDDSEQFFKELQWTRSDTTGPNAKVTKELRSAYAQSKHIRFTAESIGDWRGRGDLHGTANIAVKRNGVWKGGKFDHVRRSTTWRDSKNICGYQPVCPRVGEIVRFWLLSYDGQQATNYLEFVWR